MAKCIKTREVFYEPKIQGLFPSLPPPFRSPLPVRAAPPPSPASDLFPHPKGEIRRYSFPALAIRCERELLEAQQAEDMKEILSNVSASVDAFASLMELMDAEAKVDGVIIHILGRELQRIGKILFKMQDTYSTVELVGA